MIWAQDTNNAIGRNGTLPWHFSEDLKNFKKLTMGHVIIMGRKTWDSLPFKPLPNRQNIVISSNTIDDVETYNSIDACIDWNYAAENGYSKSINLIQKNCNIYSEAPKD